MRRLCRQILHKRIMQPLWVQTKECLQAMLPYKCLGIFLDQEKIESAIKITQSPAEIIIGRERAVLADEIPFHLDLDTKIRR